MHEDIDDAGHYKNTKSLSAGSEEQEDQYTRWKRRHPEN